MAIVQITDLHKNFGSTAALDGLNMTVEKGEIAGFLGPNGAGKSTTLRILLGLLRADSGTVRLFWQNPWTDTVPLHRRLAYVPGDVSVWPNLTGGQAIDVLSQLGDRGPLPRRTELIERFELDPSKKCRAYSKGNRQKVALIAALAADVDLYVLDEPTSGLDPLMEQVFQEVVRERRATGATVILSSHILDQVEKLCDTVTIVRDGKTVQTGTLEELRHLHRVRVTATIEGNARTLATVAGIHHLAISGQRITFTVDREETATVMAALSALGVMESTWAPPSLEDLFISEYSQDTK